MHLIPERGKRNVSVKSFTIVAANSNREGMERCETVGIGRIVVDCILFFCTRQRLYHIPME